METLTIDQKIEIMKLAMGDEDKYKKLLALVMNYKPKSNER